MLYITYGLPKSASSYMYQLTREILINSTRLEFEEILPKEIFPILQKNERTFYAEDIIRALNMEVNSKSLDYIVRICTDFLNNKKDSFIIIKTHLEATPWIIDQIDLNKIFASATFRHPADLLLSYRDYCGRLNLQFDKKNYLMELKNYHLPILNTWLSSQNTLRMDYESIIRYPHKVIKKICKHIKIDYKFELINSLPNKKDIWQFNKGVPHRPLAEMSSNEIYSIENYFSEFMHFLKNNKSFDIPIIGVVTPSLNCEDFIEMTMLSVLSQKGEFKIRYHIQDGESTDNTLNIIRKWKILVEQNNIFDGQDIEFTFESKKDQNMYQAINSGFSNIESDYYTWINSDDFFLPYAFQSISSFSDLPNPPKWIVGGRLASRQDGVPITSFKNDKNFYVGPEVIAKGLMDGDHFPYLQQEGIFFSKELLHEAGGSLSEEFELAGDFEFWKRLANLCEPTYTQFPLACFRFRSGQLSSNKNLYRHEVSQINSYPDHFQSTEEQLRIETRAILAHLNPITHDWEFRNEDINLENDFALNKVISSTQFISREKLSAFFLDKSLSIEGPYVDLGIDYKFIWLTGKIQTLRVASKEFGNFRLNITFINKLAGQEMILKNKYINKTFKFPSTSFSDMHSISVEFKIEEPYIDFELEFKYQDSDPRPLSIILKEINILKI